MRFSFLLAFSLLSLVSACGYFWISPFLTFHTPFLKPKAHGEHRLFLGLLIDEGRGTTFNRELLCGGSFL